MISDIRMSSSSAAAVLRISLLKTIPRTSSIDSPITGIRPCIMIGIFLRAVSTDHALETVSMTTLGVMTSLTNISRSFKRFIITFSSSSSIDPSASPISARAANSSREIVFCSAVGNQRRMISIGITTMIKIRTKISRTYALGTESDFQ